VSAFELDTGARRAGRDLSVRSRRPARAPDLPAGGSLRRRHGIGCCTGDRLVPRLGGGVRRLTAGFPDSGTLVIAQLVGAERGEIERQPKAVADVLADVLLWMV
jgi:hypothetical protein